MYVYKYIYMHVYIIECFVQNRQIQMCETCRSRQVFSIRFRNTFHTHTDVIR